MLTSIAAVPASTSRSPQLRVTIYSPNQSSPGPRILGPAARVGQPPPLGSHTTPRVSGATNRRPQRERTRREMPARATGRDEGRSQQHHGYRCRCDRAHSIEPRGLR
jgi:hypothetical protein